MTQPIEKQKLSSRVIKTELINWRNLQFIQQENFKDLPKEAAEKLKASIVANNFIQPFHVWADPASGKCYCLDGKHRTMMLEQLANEGHDVPEFLPATFIECENKKQAAQLVLIYSSVYARVQGEGLIDFIKLHEIDPTEMLMHIDIPSINQNFLNGLMQPGIMELEGEGKNKAASIKITFKDYQDAEKAKGKIEQLLQEFPGSYCSVSCGEI